MLDVYEWRPQIILLPVSLARCFKGPRFARCPQSCFCYHRLIILIRANGIGTVSSCGVEIFKFRYCFFWFKRVTDQSLEQGESKETVLCPLGGFLPNAWPGNTKGGSITVPLTSCLTGLESAV
jgi:hypothetical protein